MPAEDFYECMFYEQMEPFGDRRMDLFAGIIAAGVRNGFLVSKQKPLTPRDFMPNWDKIATTRPLTDKELAERQLTVMQIIQQIQNAQSEAASGNNK